MVLCSEDDNRGDYSETAEIKPGHSEKRGGLSCGFMYDEFQTSGYRFGMEQSV